MNFIKVLAAIPLTIIFCWLFMFGGYCYFATLVLVFATYSETFGVGAKNRSFIENNQLLASESAALCRAVEQDMLMSDQYHFKRLRSDKNHMLKPSGFKSIRFYDIESGDKGSNL